MQLLYVSVASVIHPRVVESYLLPLVITFLHKTKV